MTYNFIRAGLASNAKALLFLEKFLQTHTSDHRKLLCYQVLIKI